MHVYRLVNVNTAKQMSASSLETAVFKTRSGTRQGVVEHAFRVESHRELASWTVPLIQGVNTAVLAVKELSTRQWKHLCLSRITSKFCEFLANRLSI